MFGIKRLGRERMAPERIREQIKHAIDNGISLDPSEASAKRAAKRAETAHLFVKTRFHEPKEDK